MPSAVIQIGGAGPAGLAAAITLAKAGRRVLMHELQHEAGHPFGGDFQGLENWSGQHDVLDWLRELGITREFTSPPFSHGNIFDAWNGRSWRLAPRRQTPPPLGYHFETSLGDGFLAILDDETGQQIG
jgi:flavin-dependent dehydrogenase